MAELRQEDGGDVVLLDYAPIWGERYERRFWVAPNGGHVYEVTARRPGTAGRQVCARLKHRGRALWATPETLLEVIRGEHIERDLNGGR